MPTEDDLRRALEEALVEDPDDLAAHSAYADYLTERGDPRGEFISVQLAPGDGARSPAGRGGPRRPERGLLEAHEREWLGELAPLLLGTPEERRALFTAEVSASAAVAPGYLKYLHERLDFRH